MRKITPALMFVIGLLLLAALLPTPSASGGAGVVNVNALGIPGANLNSTSPAPRPGYQNVIWHTSAPNISAEIPAPSVNGSPVQGPNFSNATPAAQAGYQNVLWQTDGTNLSGQIPTAPTPPLDQIGNLTQKKSFLTQDTGSSTPAYPVEFANNYFFQGWLNRYALRAHTQIFSSTDVVSSDPTHEDTAFEAWTHFSGNNDAGTASAIHARFTSYAQPGQTLANGAGVHIEASTVPIHLHDAYGMQENFGFVTYLYGLLIGDQVNPNGTAEAIRTGAGKVHFGDNLQVDGNTVTVNGATITINNGVPTSNPSLNPCAPGSLYLEKDGGPGSTEWVCEGGAWVAK